MIDDDPRRRRLKNYIVLPYLETSNYYPGREGGREGVKSRRRFN